MEYEDSEYNSYEDDFETPDASEMKQSVKVSREKSNAGSLNYSFKDLSYKKSYKSSEITKSTNRPTSTLKPVKKTYQSLLQENKDLRSNLGQINEELSQILSALSQKPRSPKKPSSHGDPLSSRLQIYINEFIVLQNKVNKITNPEYLIQLRTEIKEKESKITSIEKLLKELKKRQKTRDKNLEKFWVEDFVPNELTTFGHMNDQLFQYREQIEKIEAQQQKDLENFEKLQEKEQELNEKLEKLQQLWDHYNSQTEDSFKNQSLKNQFEALNKQFESGRIKANNRISKLQALEKTLAFEIETFKKDLKSIQLQIDIKEKEAAQNSIELQNVASQVSQHDMGHLLSLVRIQPNNSESVPGSSQGKSFTEVKKKKKFEELFKEDLKNNKDEVNEGKKTIFSGKNDENPEKNKENDRNSRKIMKGNNPKLKNEEVIEENLPEEEESFQPQLKPNILNQSEAPKTVQFVKPLEKSSLLKELEHSEISNKFNPPQSKAKSLFEELEESSANDRFQKPKIEEPKKPEKSSFFTELENDSKNEQKAFRPIEKSSFFEELEKNEEKAFRPIEKSSFFEELEKPPKEKLFQPLEKPSLFQELETKGGNQFKPPEKSSFFDELGSKSSEKPSELFKPIPKSSFLNDFDSNREKDSESFFKPVQKSSFFDQLDSSSKKTGEKLVKHEENPFISETEPKANPLTKPKGRDRSHLFGRKEESSANSDLASQKLNLLSPEKKPEEITDFLFKGRTESEKNGYLTGQILDKMKNMAERAEKHDFFSNLYDHNEEFSFNKQLLPTKFEPSQNKPPGNPSKPKASFFELEEEDINL